MLRAWVHNVWLHKHPTKPLGVRGPKDWKGCDELIRESGEDIAILAWGLYVYEEPPRYHLEPPTHIDAWVTSAGRNIVTERDDWSKVTPFPFASFLKLSEGYIRAAEKQYEYLNAHGRLYDSELHRAIEAAIKSAFKPRPSTLARCRAGTVSK
jgi:hypothetical protein